MAPSHTQAHAAAADLVVAAVAAVVAVVAAELVALVATAVGDRAVVAVAPSPWQICTLHSQIVS